MRGPLTVGVRLEVPELAVKIATRDARVLEEAFVQLLMPAVAARDTLHAVDGDGFPGRAVAELAEHERW